MDIDKKSFDPKTLILVALVGVVFFGWQKYLEVKYPEFYSKNKSSDVVVSKKEESNKANIEPSSNSKENPDLVSIHNKRKRETIVEYPIETKLWSGKISSLGMGLTNVQELNYKDQQGNPIVFSPNLPLLQVVELDSNQPIIFELTGIEQNNFIGKGVTSDGTQIIRKVEVSFENGSLKIETEIIPSSQNFKGIGVKFSEKLKELKSNSFLMPQLDTQEIVLRSQGAVEHIKFSDNLNQESRLIDLFAISSQYFTFGYLDKSSIMANASLSFDGGVTSALLKYLVPANSDNLKLENFVFIGPKSFDLLTKIDHSLVDIINFGFFSSIGNMLLRLLKFLNQFANNWGIAIILLTLVVRLVVLPFNLMSYKSMKKMQLIQPKLKILREQYKDDPAALNRETMNLMRTEKVNPVGGCLPMFLQMPVFFALYQVLGQSVELYQAPFCLWIQDLSQKDPFYVLPVLLGLTLFIQHKITPTAMDPQQAKIMMWMPLIFSVFTLGLPAGLTLYIFISTLFGVIQQQVFMMDNKQEVSS
jgi:YidC/Oxa1 family membrane protein insertase